VKNLSTQGVLSLLSVRIFTRILKLANVFLAGISPCTVSVNLIALLISFKAWGRAPWTVIGPSKGLYLHGTTQHRQAKHKHLCPTRDSNPRSRIR
jgi:hypothetical protein